MSSSIILPKVSIVVTTYNRCQMLIRAIDSICRQTYLRDFLEVIIVDDGSTDDTPIYLNNLEQKWDNIFVITNYQNLGQTTSLMKGIDFATGELIGWVDDDDYLSLCCIELCVKEFLAKPEIGLLYTDYFVCNAQGQKLGKGSRCLVPYSPNELLISFMTFHFRLFRREVYELIGGLDSYYRMAQDYDFCLRVSELALIHHLPETLYYHVVHLYSASRTKQLDQLSYSFHAVSSALIRRNLDLDLLIIPHFSLCQKN